MLLHTLVLVVHIAVGLLIIGLVLLQRGKGADAGTCEERVIRARAIEKGMTSLISHLVECYLVNTARHEMETNPDETTQELVRIFDLLNH